MNLPIGLQTVKHLKIGEIVQKVRRFNLSAFEVFFDHFLPKDISQREGELLNKLNKNPEFLLTVHAPIISASKSYWFEVMNDCLTFAQQYNAQLFTIHPDTDSNRFIKKAIPFIQMALNEFKGIRILIENTPSTPADVINEIFEQIGQFKNVGLTYDIGHSQLAPLTSHNSKRSAREYLKKLNGPILECHLHTNRGKKDEHLSIRDPEGIINLRKIFQILIEQKQFTGPMIFEYFRGTMRKDIQLIKEL